MTGKRIPLAMRSVPAKMLYLLGALCLLPCIGCFALAATFFSRGRSNDDLHAGSSAAAIAIVFMAASFGAFVIARRQPPITQSQSIAPVVKPRGCLWLRIVSFPFAVLLLWTATVGMCESFLLCNQEYLHWFKTSRHSFGDVTVKSMIIEKVIFSTVSLAGGLFLLYSTLLHTGTSLITLTSRQNRQHQEENPFAPPQYP